MGQVLDVIFIIKNQPYDQFLYQNSYLYHKFNSSEYV